MKPTILRWSSEPAGEADQEFVRFRQYGRERHLCDLVGCKNEARWEKDGGRGVTVLYCTPCKRKAEGGDA